MDIDLNPIIDSVIIWETSFGSGLMTNQGNGKYSTSISFRTSPGYHLVNITATNPQFQTVQESPVVNVLANSLQFTPLQSSWSITRGQNTTIEFAIDSEHNWNQSVPVQFTDEDDEFSLESDIYPGITSYLEIPTSSNFSIGLHTVNVSTNSNYYIFQNSSQFTLGIIGTMNLNLSIDSAFYGESLNFTLEILDDNNETVSLVDISAYCDDGVVPFAVINYTNSSIPQSISLPLWIFPGLHNVTIKIESAFYHQFNQTIVVQVWMQTNITIVITTSNEISQDQVIA
jgi:hypothetical protein